MKIAEIDFNNYKNRLKSQLKADERFKDINFEASGVSTILNLLAYNSHYLGSYMFMLNNESSIDTAQTIQSVYSKARGLGYTPKLMKSATVECVIKCEVDKFPSNGYITLHKGKSITGIAERSAETRTFVNVDDVFLYDYEKVGDRWVFTSQPTILTEGQNRSWEFVVDSSIKYQSFVIKDKTIDVDSLRVYVKSSDVDEGILYNKAKNVFEVTTTSKVHYTSVTHDGYVEVFFGAGVFGHQPEDGMIIRCEYVSSSGELGNGCQQFMFPGFTFHATEQSNAGSNGENIESTRFNAITQYRSQNRLLTPDDYRSTVLSYFRNLQAINVWRGEDNYRKQYGKIFISVKPYFADKLSASAKKEIERKLLEDSKRLGAEPVFVDPEFIECDVEIVLTTNVADYSVGVTELQESAIQAATKFSEETLNIFGNSLSDVELNDRIRKSHNGIVSSYTRKTFRKTIVVSLASSTTNYVFFGNPITEGSVEFEFSDNRYVWKCNDVDGKIIAKTTNVDNQLVKQIGNIDYSNGSISFVVPFNTNERRTIEVKCKPKNPDVVSSFNNIVRIATVRIGK